MNSPEAARLRALRLYSVVDRIRNVLSSSATSLTENLQPSADYLGQGEVSLHHGSGLFSHGSQIYGDTAHEKMDPKKLCLLILYALQRCMFLFNFL